MKPRKFRLDDSANFALKISALQSSHFKIRIFFLLLIVYASACKNLPFPKFYQGVLSGNHSMLSKHCFHRGAV
jgi:hypothetical protein